jgi:cell division protein FtsI/penicillin-binding protein 2
MNARIRLISILIIFVSLIVVVRLYFVQIVNGETFATTAERQYINKNTVLYDRGDIYFESKDGALVPAAISRTGYTVAINPSIIKDANVLYNALSPIFFIDKQKFFEQISKKDDQYEEIGIHLNSATADKIKELNLYGVSLSTDKWRFYPALKTASQTIGFVAYSEDELAGRYGLERYYEETLKKDPSRSYNNFFAEFFINVKESISSANDSTGDLLTSIEPSTQLFVENELKDVREKWQSENAGAIIINPKNGEIYAIAFNPSFDPNEFGEYSINDFKNPLVENVYEMGSIIKPLTIASGLDAGVITATSTYFDAGTITLNKKTFSNYDGRGRGVVNMQDVLNQSLNTGVTHVALKMGNNEFSTYMKNYGIGVETGIDLPNETRGLIKNLDSTRDIEMATASFGQGIALTPIATVRALSVLANGGTLITPHIVKKINQDNGLTKRLSFAPGKRVIKEETSKEISRMLVNVVDTSLRDGTAKIPGYSIAAKTGTAQMTNEGTAGYVDGKYLHSFFGYFPADDPKFLIFLFHVYPKGVRYASETLTDPFLNITKFLINYYEIPPDRPEETVRE